MSPKRSTKAPSAPSGKTAKKAPSITTKKKATLPKPSTVRNEVNLTESVTDELRSLLKDTSKSAVSIVEFGAKCGLESLHGSENRPWERPDLTAFLMAVYASRLDVVQLLISEYSGTVNINAVTQLKYTALHIASEIGSLKMVKFLVEHGRFDVLLLNANGDAPFDVAVANGHKDVAEYLITLGNPPKALHSAALLDDINLAKSILEQGWDVNAKDEEDDVPLHFAVQKRNISLEFVKLLLDAQADPNALNSKKETPLLKALNQAAIGETPPESCLRIKELIVLLCSRGAILDGVDIYGEAALHVAINCRQNDLAMLLIDLGANPHLGDHNRCTPLHLACREGGLLNVAKALVSKGADVNAIDRDESTPLMVAIRNRNIETVLWLLELGADPTTCDVAQTSPLHLACEKGMLDVVKILLSRGIATDAVDIYGATPLHTATNFGHTHIALQLLALGANPSPTNKELLTPLHYVETYNANIGVLLRNEGADKCI